jgi:hypothetical protein
MFFSSDFNHKKLFIGVAAVAHFHQVVVNDLGSSTTGSGSSSSAAVTWFSDQLGGLDQRRLRQRVAMKKSFFFGGKTMIQRHFWIFMWG